MRALPGQASRASGAIPLTRDTVAADQRQRILRAATELFAKRGYHGATVALIIKRARVGYATFYKNFDDKEGCFLALLDGAAGRAEKRMWEAAEAEEAWPEAVAAAVRTLFELIVAEPVLARVCLVESLTAGPKAVARYEAALRSAVPMLVPGRQLKPRKAELPATLEDTLAGGVLWIAYQRLIVGEADRLPQLLPEALEFVLSPYMGEEEAVRTVQGLVAQPA